MLGFETAVGLPHLVDEQSGEHDAFRIPQRQWLSMRKAQGQGGRDVEHDRNRPKRPVGQAHVADNGVVVEPSHEAPQRREAPVQQEFEVTHLTLGQVDRLPVTGGLT